MKLKKIAGLSFKVFRSIKRNGIKITMEKIKRYINPTGQKYLLKILTITDYELNKQRKKIFSLNPLISVIVPVYNTDIKMLYDMIKSVINQTYSNWELCIADASDVKHVEVEKKIKECISFESRIKYIRLNENKGISENTNACIDIAIGDYIALLDHDDILAVNALYEVVKVINEDRADFIYSDEVKFLDSIENSFGPNFKPDFSKDELRAHNYICHLNVYKKSLLDIVGKYNSECDGSQDHDMVLRLTEVAEHIVHIPKILYYWRVHSGSVSQGIENKMYAVKAANRAVSAQLIRNSENGIVSSVLPYYTLYRITYDVNNDVEFLVVIYGDGENIEKTVSSLRKNASGVKYHVVTFNKKIYNYKTFDNIAELKNFYPNGMFIFVKNGAIIKNKGWDREVIGFLQRQDVGVVGCKIVSEGKIKSAGIMLNNDVDCLYSHLYRGADAEAHGYEACLMHVRNVTAVSPCFCGVKSELLDISNTSIEDCLIDAAMTARKCGMLNVWTPFVMCEIDKSSYTESNIIKMKWHECAKQGDVYLNPNLIYFENIF